MSIKPILMNTEMVRAILDGRKTVTRRVVKDAKSDWTFEGLSDDAAVMAVDRYGMEYAKPVDGLWATFEDDDGPIDFPMVKAPYRPGDILYVRETWSQTEDGGFLYRAWPGKGQEPEKQDKAMRGLGLKWRPSIHMPREAARIFLRVTDVRVERLQDIDADGIRSEGLTSACVHAGDMEIATQEFSFLWDGTIKPADRERYGWAANPWVFVIEFERCEKPEDDNAK